MPYASVVTFNNTTTASSTSHSVVSPSWSFETGDCLLLHFLTYGSANTITPPAGWTAVANSYVTNGTIITSQWFWKYATAADMNATFIFTTNGSNPASQGWIVLRNVNQTNPIDVAASQVSSAVGNTITIPTVTTTGVERLLILGVAAMEIWTLAAPTGGGTTTDIYTKQTGTTGNAPARTTGADSEQRPTSGATGTRSVVGTGTADHWAGHMIAIAPGAAAADTTPPAIPTNLLVEIISG